MNKIGTLFLMVTLAAVLGLTEKAPVDLPARIKELNSYWAEVSRCVREGDFAGYKANRSEARHLENHDGVSEVKRYRRRVE